MQDNRFSESLWKRGWRDTKAGWANWRFIVLEAVMAPLVGLVIWSWLALIIIVFGMLCVWIGATARAPILQRNEARTKVSTLEVEKENREQRAQVREDIACFIIMGAGLLREFRSMDTSGVGWPTKAFDEWHEYVSKTLFRHGLKDDRALWYKDTALVLEASSLGDFIQACEAGLQRLESIIERFRD